MDALGNAVGYGWIIVTVAFFRELLGSGSVLGFKVFEFIGCRTNIPIQFKVRPSAKARAVPANIDVYYMVVGSLM